MKTYTDFLGIDVSKKTLDLKLWQLTETGFEKRAYRSSNDASGHAQVITHLEQAQAPRSSTIIVMENTGRYHRLLAQALVLDGWIVSVEKTTALKKVKPEHHRKDDAFDADLLAEYAYRYQDKLTLYQAQDPRMEQIRLLYSERRHLVSERGSVKQRLGSLGYHSTDTDFAEALYQEQLTFLNGIIKRVEEHIEQLIGADEDLHRRYEQLKSIPGVGPKTAWLWLILFYGASHLDARKLASRFGFAPHGERSGSSQRGRVRSSGHGNSEVRKLLTMCARSLSEHHVVFKQYKQKKVGEGKPIRLIRNNIINRLIRIICAVWNADTFYDVDHLSRFEKSIA